MSLVDRELSRGIVGRARQVLNRHVPEPGMEDLRGWEWRYLWQLSPSDPHQVPRKVAPEMQLASTSHDGHYVAVTWCGQVSVWNLLTRTEITASPFQGQSALFSPTETLVAYWNDGSGHEADGSGEGFSLWELSTQMVVAVLPVTHGSRGLVSRRTVALFAFGTSEGRLGSWSRQSKSREAKL